MKKQFCSKCGKETKHEFLTYNVGKGIGSKQIGYDKCVRCGNKTNISESVNHSDKNWEYKLRMRVPKMPK